MTDRRFPPVAVLSTVALALVVVGGIVMASYAPRRPPLAIPTVMLVAAALVLASAWAVLARHRPFAWGAFRRVFKWALLAYVISSGMIEFAFVRDHTRGAALVVLTGMLVIFATSVPTTIAVTTARYADAD